MGIKFKAGVTDKPVETVKEDYFKITRYIDGLCEFIKTCQTPMTISIQGDWGSGKTSMMNMIRQQVDDSVHSIWINTWQYSQFNMGDTLTLTFLSHLINELDSSNKSEEAKKVISDVIKIFAKAGLTLVGFEGEAVDVLEGRALDLATTMTNLKEQFQKLVKKKLNDIDKMKPNDNKKNRIVIFVDDLDRLNPGKAVELLEVLKLFIDCEDCVFVLAVDYNVVTQGLKEKYGNLISEEKGKSFFDKIIQLPFKMPVAQYDIKGYILNMLNNIGANIKEDDDSINNYVNLVKLSIGFNPRGMKRLFNTYQLLDIILKKNQDDKNKLMRDSVLFGVICMQMEFEDLYASMARRIKLDDFDEETFNIYTEINSNDNNELIEELGLVMVDGKIDEAKLNRIVNFMEVFQKTVESLDDNQGLSNDEIAVIKEIFNFSNITSVNEIDIVEDSEVGSIRYRNRQIAKNVAEDLKRIGKFRIWQPRKVSEPLSKARTGSWTNLKKSGKNLYDLGYEINSIDSDNIEFKSRITRIDKGSLSEDLVYDEWLSISSGKLEKETDYSYWYEHGILDVSVNTEDARKTIVSTIKGMYKRLNELNIAR